MTTDVHYRLLGPVEAIVGRRSVGLGGARQRTVLAALLLHGERVVATDTLIELVWGGAPPRTAVTALHGLVSKLRRALDAGDGSPSPLVSRAPGYVIEVAPHRLDLWECERLADEGARALSAGDAERATGCFARALSLWRGPALGGATAGTLAVREGPWLEELRLACVEGRAESQLALGRHAELAPELESLVAEHPFRERLRGQHMLALYRLGRRAEALQSYRAARGRLVEEFGLEPGPALRDLERAILADDPALRTGGLPRAAAVTPEQLPPDVPDFTGRERVLATLRESLVETPDAHGSAPAVVAVSGKPGVGKSALAVHLAHSVRRRFPDGQLFVSLRGVEGERIDPADVLDEWLRALGGAPAEIPTDRDALARAYRARLSGRRVLVVIDDAADEAQVRPLLPGTGEGAVLITSRRPLAGLEGARFVALDPLDGAEAVTLLGRIAGSGRVAAEPGAAELIAQRCGGLPLAVRVAGGRLAQHDHWSLRVLADRLEDAGRRLDELRVGDLEVRASVGASYRALDEGDKRALRLLGLLDGPSFASWLAAAALDTTLAEADRALERLIDQQLLDVAGTDSAGQVRYRFHDVLADFARERLAEEDVQSRESALERALGASLSLTGALLGPIASMVPGAGTRRARRWQAADQGAYPQDQASAFRWFESERAALVAMVERASEAPGMASWELAANMSAALEQSQRWADWRRVLEMGLGASERAGDRVGRAMSLRGLGAYHNERGEPEQAARCFERALEELEGVDEPDELATALVGLADARWGQGQPAGAIPLLERSLVLLRELGHTGREAWVLYALGNAYANLGRLATAQSLYRESRDRFGQIGDARGQAYAYAGLAASLLEGGHPDDAASYFQRSQQSADQAGDHTFAFARYGLGFARRDQGRLEEARHELRAAYAMATEGEYKRGQMYALYGLGTTAHRDGSLPEAAAELERSCALAREMGDQRSTARALAALGEVRLDQGRVEESVSALRTAAEIAATAELGLTEATARASLSRSLDAAGATDDARVEQERSAQIRRELEDDSDAPNASAGSR
jgi:DNA-binding SARP family transcriptional activator/tetratricopeptide (TPR) repeat protein